MRPSTIGESLAEQTSDRIRGAARGDGEALEWLGDWLSPMMLAWARIQMRTSVDGPVTPEDLVQDVWVKLLPKLPHLRPYPGATPRMTPAILAVARRTLRNHIIDVRRSHIRGKLHGSVEPFEDEFGDAGTSPLSQCLRLERSQHLADALDRLDPRDREIFLSRVFESFSIAELAERHAVDAKEIIATRRRVRRILSQHLHGGILDVLDG